MLIFLTGESVTMIISFLIVSKILNKKMNVVFPLRDGLFALPVSQVGDEKVEVKKKSKKKSAEPELIDYQMAGVVANHANSIKLPGMKDFEYIVILIFTGFLIGFLKTIAHFILKPANDIDPYSFYKQFFDEQNMDLFLTIFLLVFYSLIISKILFGVEEFRNHRNHAYAITFASIFLGLFISMGFENFFIGDFKNSLNKFNIGSMAYFESFLRNSRDKILFTPKIAKFIIISTNGILMFLISPSIIKFADMFSVYSKSIKQSEEKIENLKTEKTDREASEKMIGEYKFGLYLLLTSISVQSMIILLHIRGIYDNTLGQITFVSNPYIVLILLIMISIGIEGFSSLKEIRMKAQSLAELLLTFVPSNQNLKQMYIQKGYSVYRSGIKNGMHVFSKVIIPLILLILLVILLRKDSAQSENSTEDGTSRTKAAMNRGILSTGLETKIENILRQHYISPIIKGDRISEIHRGFGVKSGTSLIDIQSQNPFTLVDDFSLGYYFWSFTFEAIQKILLSLMISKSVVTIYYIIVILVANDDLD